MENVFFGILTTVGILGIVLAIIHFFSRKATAPATGATTKPGGATDWGKEWEKWKEKIAIPLSVIVFGIIWWLNEPASFAKATHSRMFWSGVFLVVVLWGYFLTLPKTFKENFSRKFFMLTALPVGLVMILLSFVPVEKVKAEIISAGATSTARPQISRKINLKEWCDWIFVPPGKKFSMVIPGRVKVQWLTGEEREISPNDGLGIMPHQEFRLKGIKTPGTATVTW